MGIAMSHPDLSALVFAVDETQAQYYEAKGFTRATPDEIAEAESAARAVEDAIIRGAAETPADAVGALEELASAAEAGDLEALTNDELHALAAEHRVEVPTRATKAELIAAIQAGTEEY